MDYGYIGDPDYNFGFAANNPFLDMLAAVGEDDTQSSVSTDETSLGSWAPHRQRAAAIPPPAAHRNFKLPEYWPHAPELWFCRAELRFSTSGIVQEQEKFAYVADALNYESLSLVKDILLNPPAFQPYRALKARLLLATQLTPVQMAEKLMRAADLGDRRPSQLLAALLENCPPGEENTSLFRASFLMRLPADIRGHLDGLEDGDLKILAAKADRHWATRAPPKGQVFAVSAAKESEEMEEEPVAAVRPPFQKKKEGQPGRADGGGRYDGGQKKGNTDWSGVVQLTLCKKHQRFGNNCRKCSDPAKCEFSKLGN